MPHEILIVDDEPDIRLLVEGILRDEGYDTRQAGDFGTGAGGVPPAPAEPGGAGRSGSRDRSSTASASCARCIARSRRCRW